MSHVFAEAGYHNHAKALSLYFQMMKAYRKESAETIAKISSFQENGNHVVRY